MALAQLQFAALLQAMLVPWRVDLCMPTAQSPAPQGVSPQKPVGGGVSIIPSAVCLGRVGCLALIQEPALPFTTPSRLDGLQDPPTPKLHFRMHIVKRPDLFTTWDGHLPYTVRRM